MEFVAFCKAHGILIDHIPPIGVWKRYPTEDHPKKRNGAVKFMGTHGYVQNHATETDVSVWKPDSIAQIDTQAIMRQAREAEQRRQEKAQAAERKAAWILSQCKFGKHGYLKTKGFPDEEANVWMNEGVPILVIPMRERGRLVGCQLISESGEKKFLLGQRTAGVEFIFDNKGPHYYCEGYATALSLRQVLKNMKRRYTIHVCFSAGNLARMAKGQSGYVIADNDASGTGQRVAEQSGLPYWMSDVVGEDANDYAQRVGIFKFSQSLTQSLRI